MKHLTFGEVGVKFEIRVKIARYRVIGYDKKKKKGKHHCIDNNNLSRTDWQSSECCNMLRR